MNVYSNKLGLEVGFEPEARFLGRLEMSRERARSYLGTNSQSDKKFSIMILYDCILSKNKALPHLQMQKKHVFSKPVGPNMVVL
jgi:hypothetical protein